MALKTDREKLAHILRRFGLGASESEISSLMAMGYRRAVDHLLDDATPDAGPDISFEDWFTTKDVSNTAQLSNWWTLKLLTTQRPVVEKMVLFWHNHFATSYQAINYPRVGYIQNDLFRKHSLGNFRQMLMEVSRDPAMTFWLNGNLNVKGRPNENFAREVMELFTLGIGHYTEKDIQEGARAFTGWNMRELPKDKNGLRQFEFAFTVTRHDNGIKTFRGTTANLAGEDILNALCDDRRTSEYIAWKMWDWFVYRNPEPQVVARIAKVFYDSGYEIKALVRAIIDSPEFFSAKAERKVVKSPVDFCIATGRQLGVGSDLNFIDDQRTRNFIVATTYRTAMRDMGMHLFFPPDVHGWDYGESWITTATMLERIKWPAKLLGKMKNRMPVVFAARAFLAELSDATEIVNRFASVLDAPLSDRTRQIIVANVERSLDLDMDDEACLNLSAQICSQIFASPEFQFA